MIATTVDAGGTTKEQDRIAVLDYLYSIMPIGKEKMLSYRDMMGTHLFAFSSYTLEVIMRQFEREGILSRNVRYTKGIGAKGKRGYITLRMEKDEALRKLHINVNAANETTSLKKAITEAFKQKNTFSSTSELTSYLRNQGNRTSDGHDLTHLLHVLRKEGKITFNTDQKGTPINMRATPLLTPKNVVKMNDLSIEQRNVVSTLIEADKAAKEAQANAHALEEAKKIIEEREDRERTLIATNHAQFPLIAKIVNRKTLLESAAEMAEAAGADEIALQLMAKIEENLSPLEEEVVRLYHLWEECKGK